MARELSAGKVSSCRECAQISGIQTCCLAEDEGPKQGLSKKLCSLCLSQKLCCFYSLHSHLHRLVSQESRTQDGSPNLLRQSPPRQTPLLWQGMCLDVWSPKCGLLQKLSSRHVGGVLRLLAYLTRCWNLQEGICDPG